jgi:hypothetical protein
VNFMLRLNAAEIVTFQPENIIVMQLEIWLPTMFLLGLVSMGGCFLFVKACEEI